MNSDGWTLKPAISIHRRAPLISDPTTSVSASITRNSKKATTAMRRTHSGGISDTPTITAIAGIRNTA